MNGGSLLPPFFYTDAVSRIKPIYLVGMMGVGKSTVGARLAKRLGCGFLDTDREVEREAGRTIAEIFAREGESHFRWLESQAIERASQEAAVVALGGGAVVQPGVLSRLLESGQVVFLMADPELLIERVGDPSSRPLLAGLTRDAQIEKLNTLLAERLPFYQRANIRIDARGSTEDVVDRIVNQLDCG